MTRIAPKHLDLALHVASAAVVSCVMAVLVSAVPFYPSQWSWLAILATGALWVFAPRAGTAFAILSLMPALAYQSPHLVPFALLCAIVAGTAGPYYFLVSAATLAALVSGVSLSSTLAVPLLFGFGKTTRAATAAFATCLVLTIPLTDRDPDSASLLNSGQIASVFATKKPVLDSFTQTGWIPGLAGGAEAASGKFLKTLGTLVEHPLPLAQAGLWAVAASVASFFRGRFVGRARLASVAGTAAGSTALLAGYLFALPLLGHPSVPVSTAIAGVLLPGILVGLLGPIFQRTAEALGERGYGQKSPGGAARAVPSDTWSELAGIDDIQRETTEAVDSQFDAAARRTRKSAGIRPVKGILLFGPPGTGKTKIARIIANQAGAAFYAVSGSDFATRWFGESESNLRSIFDEARRNRPAVLFFDELEAFLPKRSEMAHADSPEKRIVATFLANTDGIDELENVLLVGATNHPEMIDPAALRPGRFDKLIYVPPPGLDSRIAILERYLQRRKIAADVDLEKLGGRLERFTGADIEALCSTAMRHAMERTGRRKPAIAREDFDAALSGIRPSVSIKTLKEYEKLSSEFGRTSSPVETHEVIETPKLSWSDVAGLEETKDALRESIELPLTHAGLLQEYRVRPAKGVLLFGPPGCGKTFLAKVVASEAGVRFLHVKGPELLRSGTGDSEERLRDLFLRARENPPSVLFFDEIDAIAGARGTGEASSTKILTQLLTEMDGLEELKGVVVVAATNRPDMLDEALLRPGRFDRVVYVPPPDSAARRALIEKELADKPLDGGIDLESIAAEAEGLSAAEIVSFCNSAALAAAKESLASGTRLVLDQGFLRHFLRRTPRSLTAETVDFYEGLRDRLCR